MRARLGQMDCIVYIELVVRKESLCLGYQEEEAKKLCLYNTRSAVWLVRLNLTLSPLPCRRGVSTSWTQ